MKNIFSRFKKKKAETDDELDEELSDEDFPERIPYRLGTVKDCVPSPTAEGKPENEKVYIMTLIIDGEEYRAAQTLRLEQGQKVVATTIGNIALIFPDKTAQLNADED